MLNNILTKIANYLKIGEDKIKHFLLMFIGSILFAGIFGIYFSFMAMLVVSVGKEIWDINNGNETGFSTEDLIADIFGILIGLGIFKLILFIR